MEDLVIAKLKSNKQEKLLMIWNQIDKSKKDILLEQLNELNLENILDLYENSVIEEDANELFSKNLKPITECHIDYKLCKISNEKQKIYELAGLKAISNGQVGIICLAGGVSTRLSISYPKGMYSVDLLSNKSLFQLQAERLIRIKNLSNELNHSNMNKSSLPLYVLTSEHTHFETCEYFQTNNYFGLTKENVVFFEQEMLPCLSIEGNLLLNENYSLCKAPNGTNGLYKALVEKNVLEDMKKRGIKYVHVYCVDNILVKMADPILTGICIENNIGCAVKIAKQFYSREPINPIFVGTDDLNKYIIDFTKANNFPTKNQFNYGDIGYYFLKFDILEKICKSECIRSGIYSKIVHSDVFRDENGALRKQLCSRLEQFLTDQFPVDFKLIEVNRYNEYSPLKYMINSEHYTKLYCKDDLMTLHYNWMLNAGARFHYPGKPFKEIKSFYGRNDQSNTDDITNICEISPLLSYDGENLEKHVKNKSFEPPIVLDLDLETNKVTFNGLDPQNYWEIYPNEFFK